MTLADFLIQLTRFIYILLGGLTLIDFLRRRNRTQLDISLLFGTLALIVGIQQYITLTGERPVWLVKIIQLNLMAHPYLLLQVVEHFRPVPTRIRWAALIGMFGAWLILLVLPELPLAVTLSLVIYFALVEIYSVAAFIRGAFTTGGVTRWRLGLTAGGSAMIAAVMILAGINAAIPTLAPYTALLIQVLAVCSGLSYYFGLSPTRWIRRAWQLSELYSFLREAAGKPAAKRGETMLSHLCTTALRTTGGRAALVALWDEDKQQLIIQASTHHPLLKGTISTQQGAIGRAWQTRQPALAFSLAEFAPESAKLASVLETQALIAVPIFTIEQRWGMLVVLLQRPSLFPDDDMDLLVLFAEQSALALEQMRLLTEQKAILSEQQKLVEQLRERTTQLEETNNELEAFSYSVSHDLRAPLRHIEGFTDFLNKSEVVQADEKSLRYLTLITEAARRMGRLIDNLLTFSRLGRSALTITVVDLGSLVEEARQELHVDETRNIVWKIGRLPRVHCDPELLRLVLINLLSNAVKYTRPRAQAQIEIESVPEQLDGVVICVRDNGVGFDMEYADKLFGVFQRLHHDDEFEGTGIGLANVRRIIHRHGGRTWAESSPDQGAAFYFSLPSYSIDLTSPMINPPPLRSSAFLFAPPTTSPGKPASSPPP